MSLSKPQLPVFPGTDRLGRPLTNEEKAAFAKALRESDYVGARLVALRFAHKLARGREGAKNLMSRVDLRLVRLGWDPNAVSLVKCLCRYVWSEWTHQTEETAAAHRIADAYLQEAGVTEPRTAPSAEDIRAQEARRRRDEVNARARLDELRAHFEKARDEVNLLWLDYSRQEIDDLKEMARRSGRDVQEFYRAAERRKRLVRRLLAEGPGVKYEEDD